MGLDGRQGGTSDGFSATHTKEHKLAGLPARPGARASFAAPGPSAKWPTGALLYWHTAVELTVYHWIRIHSRIAISVCALVTLPPWHCETSCELAASVMPSGVVR